MQHHSHCTVYNGQSSQRCEISASVMQGSAIGPAMFDVEAADLKTVTPENLLCKYADDTVQYIVIPASNSYIQTTELAHVNLWAKLKNLSLNRAKTVETIFAHKNSNLTATPPPPLPGIRRRSTLNILGHYTMNIFIHHKW